MKSYLVSSSFLFFFLLLTIKSCHGGVSCYHVGVTGCRASCQYQNCLSGYCDGNHCYCTECNQNSNSTSTVTFTETVTYYHSYSFGRKRSPAALATGREVMISEDGRSFQVCLTAEGNLDNNTIIVRVGTVAGTATAREDFYQLVDETYLIFTETNKTDRCFDMVIFDDNLIEDSENFTITLSAPIREEGEPQLVDLTTLKPLAVTIIDNDNLNSGATTNFKLLKITLITAVLVGLIIFI